MKITRVLYFNRAWIRDATQPSVGDRDANSIYPLWLVMDSWLWERNNQ